MGVVARDIIFELLRKHDCNWESASGATEKLLDLLDEAGFVIKHKPGRPKNGERLASLPNGV